MVACIISKTGFLPDSATMACSRSLTRTAVKQHLQIPNETALGRVCMLEKQPGSPVVVGAHHGYSDMFRLDSETDQSTPSLDKIVAPPGQLNCATFLDGIWYLGVYGGSILAAYRPDRPFVCNENPRTITTVGHEQNRPVGIVNDGRYVYMASKATYQRLGGAITVLDPGTEKIQVYRDFVPSQNPQCLFYHPSGLLLGTTQTFGDMRSCTARDKNAVLFAWDTRLRKTVHTSYPWESDSLGAYDLSPDGILIGFNDDHYFLFNALDFSCVLVKSDIPQPPAGEIFLDARRFLGSYQKPGTGEFRFFILDIASNRVEDLGPTQNTQFFAKLSDHEVLIKLVLNVTNVHIKGAFLHFILQISTVKYRQ